MNKPAALGLILGLLCLPREGRSDMASTSQSLSTQVSAYGEVSVNASFPLYTSGTAFQAYTGSVTVNYKARTSTGGGGSLTVRAGSDFSPSNGPTVASGLTALTCSGATLGTGCSGSQTLSLSVDRPVVTLPAGACTGGGGACSNSDPNLVTLNFSLGNRPQYKTGNYTASLIFTVSAE